MKTKLKYDAAPGLYSGIQLIRSLYNLNIKEIKTGGDIEVFCKENRVHRSQKFLNPEVLEGLCNSEIESTVHLCEDHFMTGIAILCISDRVFVAGPYRQSILSEKDAEYLLEALDIKDLSKDELLRYRGALPILTYEDIEKIVKSLVRVYDPDSVSRKISKHGTEDFEISRTDYMNAREEALQADRPYYMTMLERRYTFEQHFIENIEAGNARSALMNLENMQHDVSYLKRIGTTMENERIGAAITRTTVRLAAIRAGLPAIIVDKISSENTRKTMSAKTATEILKAKEEMVHNFCHAIQEHNDEQHSALAQSAVYYLRHEYYHPINLDAMADTLSVSKNYLISVFRKEYGTTPISFLNDYRLKQAAILLASTSSTVQEISNSVGIDDANYFVKLFRKKYGMTPTEYRRRNKL